ncbi:G1 family glutamic endopeptidase [Baekduia soli]|nr:G1 family glutamic endopeptidase [Baekduia soli]
MDTEPGATRRPTGTAAAARPRSAPRLLALAGALAWLIATTSTAIAHASATVSSNWAGYVAHRSGVRFEHATASWVQPTTTCSAGRRTYSADWVGLGGYSSTSKALEQIGTEADCSSNGSAHYSSWFEIVPQAGRRTPVAVRPGDLVTAAVTVSGSTVTLRLVDHTTGAAFSRRTTASPVDVTSAEWIVEAPSLCLPGAQACETMPLADFSGTTFGAAAATDRAGHTGGIADPSWRAVSVDLATGAAAGRSFADGRLASIQAGGRATVGGLDGPGRSFTVTYQDTQAGPPGTPGISGPGSPVGPPGP